jgi:hypothetical protein
MSDIGRTDSLLIVGLLVADRFIGLSLGLSPELSVRILFVELSVAGSLEGSFEGKVSVEHLSASFRLFASRPCIFLYVLSFGHSRPDLQRSLSSIYI